MFNQLGHNIVKFFSEIGSTVHLFFSVAKSIVLGRLHMKNFKEQIVLLGHDSLPIVVITMFSIGMVFALQVSKQFIKYGASNVVGGVLGLSIWRELGPVMTAVVVAGRVGAAITAELGSMKVTEQIDAIKSFGVDIVNYLVVPRVAALSLILPLLCAIADFVGVFGGYVISVGVMEINQTAFFTSIQDYLTVTDLVGGVFKAFVFAIVISLISCRQGLSTRGGALGVGNYTTRSVVISLISIFILDYFLTSVIF